MAENFSGSSSYESIASRVDNNVHPMVKRLVAYRYDYSDEPLEEIVGSGTLNMYRNGWFAGVTLAAELLIEERLIEKNAFYFRRLRRFIDRYQDIGGGFHSTRRTAGEVESGKLLVTLMLDHLYPKHIYFDQAKETRTLHVPAPISWKV